MITSPVAQLIAVVDELVVDRFDAGHPTIRGCDVEPIPEARAELEAVVVALGVHQHVGVKQPRHHTTPRCSASPSNVDSLLTSRSRNARVYGVRLSFALAITARAKRRLT